jgi:RNA recognition motif-containing protein
VKNIFVGNLDFGATEASLRQLFEPFGAVERVNMIIDRDTGRARGFAFIEMSDAAAGDSAISSLDGTDIGGRTIKVNEARPKDGGARQGFAGGGAGGGQTRQRREPRW